MTENKLFANPIFLVALEVELPKENFRNLNIKYTGVGKVNAAYCTMKNITLYRPTVVINFGSAGSLCEEISGLVQVKEVTQRDMDVEKLGFHLGETPFEKSTEKLGICDSGLPKGNKIFRKVSCSTGDNFVTEPPKLSSQIVDMELYAIAKVCLFENIPIMAWKYISDNADGNSVSEWKNNVRKGSSEFKKLVIDKL